MFDFNKFIYEAIEFGDNINTSKISEETSNIITKYFNKKYNILSSTLLSNPSLYNLKGKNISYSLVIKDTNNNVNVANSFKFEPSSMFIGDLIESIVYNIIKNIKNITIEKYNRNSWPDFNLKIGNYIYSVDCKVAQKGQIGNVPLFKYSDNSVKLFQEEIQIIESNVSNNLKKLIDSNSTKLFSFIIFIIYDISSNRTDIQIQDIKVVPTINNIHQQNTRISFNSSLNSNQVTIEDFSKLKKFK